MIAGFATPCEADIIAQRIASSNNHINIHLRLLLLPHFFFCIQSLTKTRPDSTGQTKPTIAGGIRITFLSDTGVRCWGALKKKGTSDEIQTPEDIVSLYYEMLQMRGIRVLPSGASWCRWRVSSKSSKGICMPVSSQILDSMACMRRRLGSGRAYLPS